MKGRSALVLVALIAFLASACNAVLTPDGTAYSYTNPSPGSVTISAPSTSGVNEREFLWDGNTPVEAYSTVCATFATGQGQDQEGIALRINWSSSAITGITVTRNVFDDGFNIFNFHVWNTADTTDPFVLFASTNLSSYLPASYVYPLNMCARAVGDLVQFVVWTSGSQPLWGSTLQGGQATIPASAPTTGQGGWYAGHVVPGTSMSYTGMTVDGALDTDPIGA